MGVTESWGWQKNDLIFINYGNNFSFFGIVQLSDHFCLFVCFFRGMGCGNLSQIFLKIVAFFYFTEQFMVFLCVILSFCLMRFVVGKLAEKLKPFYYLFYPKTTDYFSYEYIFWWLAQFINVLFGQLVRIKKPLFDFLP